jgi:4-hydroxybenzoate polyprenyltransferase
MHQKQGSYHLNSLSSHPLRWTVSRNNTIAPNYNPSHYYSTTAFHLRENTTKCSGIYHADKLDKLNSLQEDSASTSSVQSKSTDQTTTEVSASSQLPPSEPSIHNISYLPESLQPYAHLSRLDKPIGTYLLLHPCLWSTALASPPGALPDLKLCALFATGAFVMRGAGCTINDMWDANFDREVERTRSRPLASGALNYRQATAWLGLQLAVGLGVLVSLPHVETCFLWGVASLPLVATYPLMKRYTDYPQLVLGMTFNWGAIMGWVAVRGEVDWSVVGPLYASGVSWTLVYDTLYAHQDKKDDAKLGLKSTALTFGENTKPILSALAAATWAGWMAAGYNCGFGIETPYYYVGCSVAAAHLLWQVQSADLSNAENLAYRFRSNNLVGWIIFGSCALGNVTAG